MKKHITRSLCCLLALLLCLGSAIYTPAAQDDQTQVSFTVTLATGKTTDYATLKVQDKDGKTMPCQEDEYGYDTYDYLLPAGDYTYTATYQSGSQTASGSFTVAAGETRQIPVQLTYTQYKVRFNTTPQNATVALYKNGRFPAPMATRSCRTNRDTIPSSSVSTATPSAPRATPPSTRPLTPQTPR